MATAFGGLIVKGFELFGHSHFSKPQLCKVSQLQSLVPIMPLSNLFKTCFMTVLQGNLITIQKKKSL